MLVALINGARIEAWAAEKGPDYCCPGCKGAVMLKKGNFKVAHFAHYPPVTCSWAKGETKEHMAAKKDFAEAFAARGYRTAVEYVLDSLKGDRRADVMFWNQSGNFCAVEIQHSPLDIDAIKARTISYLQANSGVIWVSLIKPALWKEAKKTATGFIVNRYSPRPWERWAHVYTYGKLWFYDPTDKSLWCGHFDKHESYVEETSWYDSDGNENYGGGYMRTSKRYKKLTLEGPFGFDQVTITTKRRQPETFGKYSVPGGFLANLVVAGDGR